MNKTKHLTGIFSIKFPLNFWQWWRYF